MNASVLRSGASAVRTAARQSPSSIRFFSLSSDFEVTPKTTTGLVGLDVNPNAREELYEAYVQTLDDLEAKLPKDFAYRTAVEKYVTFRLDVVKTSKTTKEIEDRIAAGHIEEVLATAKREIGLIEYLYSNREDMSG